MGSRRFILVGEIGVTKIHVDKVRQYRMSVKVSAESVRLESVVSGDFSVY